MEAEKIIFSYIRSRGLKNTEQALRSEVKNHSKFDLNQGISLEKCESAYISLVVPLSDEFIEDTFYNSFLLYKSWAESSLDAYKNDLKKFSDPFFTYMYLYLLKKDKVDQARSFFTDFSDCLSSYDKSNLSTIQTQNDICSTFVKRNYFHQSEDLYTKYLVVIRKSSLLLLMSFIEENKLSCLILILNMHIEIYLCLESCNDNPVLITDIESYKNKNFLSLNVVVDEDKRREIKVPLPSQCLDYMNQCTATLEEKADLTSTLPYIICHNIKTGNERSTDCTCIDISEDGSLVIAGFEDSCIRVWNLCQHDSAVLVGHSSSILSVSLSPDKSLFISSSDDSNIRLWSLITNTCISIYYFHVVPVWCVKFSPTGHYFASGGHEGAACIWSLEYPTPLKILCGHVLDIFCIQFHPRATFLATGSADKTLRIWDSSTGECVRIFCGHQCPLTSVFFSRNGKFVYSGDEEGTLQSWDINEKESLWSLKIGQFLTSICTSQENTVIACALQNSKVLLVSSTGKIMKSCRTKNLNLYFCTFTLRNMLAVGGSFK